MAEGPDSSACHSQQITHTPSPCSDSTDCACQTLLFCRGGGRREISISRLSLPCCEPSASAFGLGRSWGGERELWGETSLCSTHLGCHPGNLPSSWQTLFILYFPSSPGCFLIAFKGHFSSSESQCALFIPLSQTVERMPYKKHPKELTIINRLSARKQVSQRTLTHSSCEG